MLGQPQPNGLIGESAVFREMLAAIAKIASYDATVLISGETGSGKELAARAIHYQGKRSDKPFIPVNCGALPDHLIENELFGHCRGAYTDARDNQTGLIAQAEGGTLFLDEVGNLGYETQVQLLRADWTRQDPAITRALQSLGRSGVPVYVLYLPGKPPVVMSELLSKSEVLDALQQI